MLKFLRLRGKAARLRRLGQAVHWLMKYVGMTGQCDCLLTYGANGRPGYLLTIRTSQQVPVDERELFQSWFRRKLAEMGEIGPHPLMVSIHDSRDWSRARKLPGAVSSGRVASIIAAANPAAPPDQLALHLAALRQQFVDSRRKPAINDTLPAAIEHATASAPPNDDAFAPTQSFNMTDLGQL
jgi:hypothetical protein